MGRGTNPRQIISSDGLDGALRLVFNKAMANGICERKRRKRTASI